jgi:hypothetical protein
MQPIVQVETNRTLKKKWIVWHPKIQKQKLGHLTLHPEAVRCKVSVS